MLLSDIEDIDDAVYKGETQFTKFNFGKLLQNNSFGLATFQAEVDGQGFTLANLSTLVKGNISAIEINNYTYHNVSVLGKIQQKIFNGNLISKDDNLKLTLMG